MGSQYASTMSQNSPFGRHKVYVIACVLIDLTCSYYVIYKIT